MLLAEKVCITAAFVYLMAGLATGVWKYRSMINRVDAAAPYYVDIAHRSALLYSFAALLLGKLASLSAFPDAVNTTAAAVTLAFFAFAILSYIVHGFLDDTDNQLRRPHVLGRGTVPRGVVTLSMSLLVAGETGGALVLGTGAMITLWGTGM